MNKTTWAGTLTLVSVALLAGCQQPSPQSDGRRPQPGDTLTPEIVVVEPWRAETPAMVYVRLQAAGAGPTRLLRVGELDAASLPRVNVTFYRGEEPIGPPQDLTTVQDC